MWISLLPLPLSWLTHPPLPPYPYQPPVNRVETNNQLINGQSIYNTNLNNNKIAIRTMSLQPAVPTPIPHTHDSNVLPPTSFPNKQPQTVPPSPGLTRQNRSRCYQESFSSDGTWHSIDRQIIVCRPQALRSWWSLWIVFCPPYLRQKPTSEKG